MLIQWEKLDGLNEVICRNIIHQPEEIFIDDLHLVKINGYIIEPDKYEIYNDKEYIGYVIFHTNGEYLSIDYLELEDVNDRDEHGMMVIKGLVRYFNVKHLVSSSEVDSISFWNRLGAEVPSEYLFYDKEYIIPFMIEVEEVFA